MDSVLTILGDLTHVQTCRAEFFVDPSLLTCLSSYQVPHTHISVLFNPIPFVAKSRSSLDALLEWLIHCDGTLCPNVVINIAVLIARHVPLGSTDWQHLLYLHALTDSASHRCRVCELKAFWVGFLQVIHPCRKRA
jgi:hypothetical protein